MRRHLFTTVAATAVLLLVQAYPAEAAGPPFDLSVKKDRFLGGSKGTLIFTTEGIEYRTTNKDDARRWTYDDVKQLQILSPTRIAVLTYEDQGRLKFGADRTFDFTVVQDTAVMPQYGGEPLFRARVKHQQQGRGSQGMLAMYDRQLLYVTEQEGEARYWRFSDISSVLQLDRYRLQVTVYEGDSGETRPFVFELKSDLPEGFYDALWARVNHEGQYGKP
jgi:stalled ribosome alternative rescue factor ArfA